MGIVAGAHHLDLDQPVAIKLLLPDGLRARMNRIKLPRGEPRISCMCRSLVGVAWCCACATTMSACMGLDAPPGNTLARIQQHLDAGVKAGVARLPVVFVNGRYFSGTFSHDQLRALVAEELAAAGRGGAARGRD